VCIYIYIQVVKNSLILSLNQTSKSNLKLPTPVLAKFIFPIKSHECYLDMNQLTWRVSKQKKNKKNIIKNKD
jgi:hypothetical protein